MIISEKKLRNQVAHCLNETGTQREDFCDGMLLFRGLSMISFIILLFNTPHKEGGGYADRAVSDLFYCLLLCQGNWQAWHLKKHKVV